MRVCFKGESLGYFLQAHSNPFSGLICCFYSSGLCDTWMGVFGKKSRQLVLLLTNQPPDFQKFPIMIKASEAEKNFIRKQEKVRHSKCIFWEGPVL